MRTCPAKCKDNKIDGLCPNKSQKDGLSLRCIGSWSVDKMEYFRYYAEMFSTGMKYKWQNLYYVDLFSGPGRCIERESLKEFPGSPINALKIKDQFTKYHFVDINKQCISDLKSRIGKNSRVEYYSGDCNREIIDIVDAIPKFTLSLAIIDPSSLQFSFDSYRKLAEKKVDLIVNYPIGPVERAVSSSFNLKSPAMDKFHPDWREAFSNEFGSGGKRQNMLNLIKDYKNKICSLGYVSGDLSDCPVFKNNKNSILYYLIAFSKHEKGIDFWRKGKERLEKKRNNPSLF